MRLLKTVKFVSLFCLACVYPISKGATIIFDLGQVLVKTSTLSLLKNIGLYNLIGIYNPLTLEKKLIEFLSTLSTRSIGRYPISLYHGKIMPIIMQDWLCGFISSEEVLALIDKCIDKHPEIFNWPAEKKLIYEIARIIFTPHLFIDTIRPVKHAIKLLEKCAQQKDAQGNKLHKIYVLSNWDHESFEILCKKIDCSKLFKQTDGIIISGLQGKMKPDPEIFIDLFTYYKIDPNQELIVYIDDDLANIQSAHRLNTKIKTIHCQNCDLKSVKREFRKLGIIS